MRSKSSNLSSHAESIVKDDIFQKVLEDMKRDALLQLNETKLKGYAQENLSRDRMILEYQTICDFEKRFLTYAKRLS